jgi:hypothetical protein
MATPAEELDVDGVKVRLTNPDKVYFPKLGKDGTKGKLVEYYLAVASGPMLTALRDRPTHLQRFPDGIDGEEIYQKRVPQKHPDYLETCVVSFPSGRTADALKVTHPSAIVWAAQMGTITLRRGDDVVVEGRARGASLHRLQPKCAGPHVRVGVFRAQDSNRDGVDAAFLGRAARRRPRRLHHRHGAETGCRPR